MTTEKKRLGEMLIEAGVIDEMQLNSALGQQKQWGGKLASVLIGMGFVDEKAVVSVLEKQLNTRCTTLEDKEIPQKALNAVNLDIAKKYCLMPLDLDKNTLTIAMGDPTDMKTIDDLTFMLGLRIKPVLALESEIKKAIAYHYEGITAGGGKTHRAAMEKISETMQMVKTEPAGQATQAEVIEKRVELPEKPAEKKEITQKTVIEALIAILIEKKIITREELLRKSDEKARKN